MKLVKLSLPATKSNYALSINFDTFLKPSLETIAKHLNKYFSACDLAFSSDSTRQNIRVAGLIKDGLYSAIKKPEYVAFYSSFFSKIGNVFRLMEGAAPQYLPVWMDLIKKPILKQSEIDKKVGKTINLLVSSGWSPTVLPEDPMLFGTSSELDRYDYFSRSYSSYNNSISRPKRGTYLSPSVRKLAATYFLPPDSLDNVTVKTLPDGAESENFESSINQEIGALHAYTTAHSFIGQSENLVYSKLKTLEKKKVVAEFDDYGERDFLSRTLLIAAAYGTMLLHKDNSRNARIFKPDSTPDFARYVATIYPRELGSVAYRTLFPYYQGFTKTITQNSKAEEIATTVRELLAPAADAWLDMSNFMIRFLISEKRNYISGPYTPLFVKCIEDTSVTRSDVEIAPHASYKPGEIPDEWRDITWGYVEAYIRLLVAAGILEQAFVAPRKGVEERMLNSYVRLTPLGRYAFGMSRTYEAPVQTGNKNDYELDDRNMIITLLNPDTPLRFYFERYGRPISRSRYLLNANTIIQASANQNEAISNIGTLRQALQPEKDTVWDKMLRECELRATSRMPDGCSYKLVTLNPETPGLIDFINNTTDIRAHIIRTESARILVEADYYETFTRLLRAAGYLLN